MTFARIQNALQNRINNISSRAKTVCLYTYAGATLGGGTAYLYKKASFQNHDSCSSYLNWLDGPGINQSAVRNGISAIKIQNAGELIALVAFLSFAGVVIAIKSTGELILRTECENDSNLLYPICTLLGGASGFFIGTMLAFADAEPAQPGVDAPALPLKDGNPLPVALQEVVENKEVKEVKNNSLALFKPKESEKTFAQRLDQIKFSSVVPEHLCCPITKVIMTNPVVAGDGHTYENEAIKSWVKFKKISPIENIDLPNLVFIPNKGKQSEILEFVKSAEREFQAKLVEEKSAERKLRFA